ncbi:unnamed protein product [Bursaphelenchus xylophilus]|uniref:(pine wood nematode) hypothetical protein n=1 Tax=Bursaphelenchus xylophilus TaxID=6326 RepID=A0A1I7RL08_BURXY|nr:unnamed protein product [Bursaphelenchus xylophilus]CAG9083620.1 unnamed protein product [Bursaphelenchus xylophilus]
MVRRTVLAILASFLLVQTVEAVRCLDCIGESCMGDFCNGDVCVVSQFTPRWGSLQRKSEVVKGCMSGKMLRKNLRSHCEVAEDTEDVFTCFCDDQELCNKKPVRKYELEEVKLYQCTCKGPHCDGKTCYGELCSFVKNHLTGDTEQGCVNASLPLVERRSAGACMMPPMTGAMHHSVAKDAEQLQQTESCICAGDFCNRKKPKITVNEDQRCNASVEVTMFGNKASSGVETCLGEYCFIVNIASEMGVPDSYRTQGCLSYVDGAELAEELNPTGCAKFDSEKLKVQACLKTNNRKTIRRAEANRQEPPKSKGKKVEIEYDEEEEEEEREEGEEEEKEKSERKQEKEEKEENEEEEDEKTVSSTPHYIFERPTLPPEPEDSNTALISVFGLLILLIALSGVVWKFELHKRLFRANYDTVAGG